jgi:hypothetical protein
LGSRRGGGGIQLQIKANLAAWLSLLSARSQMNDQY